MWFLADYVFRRHGGGKLISSKQFVQEFFLKFNFCLCKVNFLLSLQMDDFLNCPSFLSVNPFLLMP